MKALEYRPSIDGLRALAVIAVIIYHAELYFGGEKILTGGYLGVDIFFVISGYVIGRLLIHELLSKGYIDLRDFYERRARRILPALFLVMLVSLPLAYYLFLPYAQHEFRQSIAAAVFFISNLFFYSPDSTPNCIT